MVAETIVGILIWSGLGVLGWWLYFRPVIGQLKDMGPFWAGFMGLILCLTCIASLIIGPVSFAALIDPPSES